MPFWFSLGCIWSPWPWFGTPIPFSWGRFFFFKETCSCWDKDSLSAMQALPCWELRETRRDGYPKSCFNAVAVIPGLAQDAGWEPVYLALNSPSSVAHRFLSMSFSCSKISAGFEPCAVVLTEGASSTNGLDIGRDISLWQNTMSRGSFWGAKWQVCCMRHSQSPPCQPREDAPFWGSKRPIRP